MFLLIGSFVAGVLTVLAPCVLPLLPVIIGGSVSGDAADKKRPVIITAALAASLVLFTLLLKATTLLINVPPRAITYISGGIIVVVGVVLLFPDFYTRVLARIGLEQRAQRLLGAGYRNKSRLAGPIIIGAALGPVFSSCSPVYAYILATVLPANVVQAFAYMIAYVLGLCGLLLLIGYFGQRVVGRIRFASNPRGWFQRTVAILFIVVGILVATGGAARLQTYVAQHTPFDFNALSAKLLPKSKHAASTGADSNLFNVVPFGAPELSGGPWINSPPLTLKQLHGKVVLVDFWTYSCINCIRNNIYLEKWYNAYKNDGLVIIGVHAPEFAFEKIPANVQQGVRDQHLTYPVMLDNDYATRNAYSNRSWPASYLIDAQGNVRRVHEGEGSYNESEQAIRKLLAANGAHLGAMTVSGEPAVPISAAQTPETYFGLARAQNYAGMPDLALSTQHFTAPSDLGLDAWALGGTWEVQDQKIIARGHSTLSFRVSAKDVYLVGGSPAPQTISVQVDGQPFGGDGADTTQGKLAIAESKLYHLASFPQFGEHLIQLSVPDGTELNTFTFGS